MRVSELLVCCLNDPDRIVIMDKGKLDLYQNDDKGKTVKYSCRIVKSFILETINHKTTIFIELKEIKMIRCEFCKKCVQLMSAGRVYCERSAGKRICAMQSQNCEEFEPKPCIYYDTDSIKKPKPIACTILWSSGETTYLKGKNALRIARAWLYSDPECLLVYTPGWIYLKGGDQNG